MFVRCGSSRLYSASTAVTLFVLFVMLSFVSFAEAAWYDSNYGYCRALTMTAGGGSGGVATTTTGGFALVATSTISSLATTGNGGRIESTSTASGTTTPVDVVITNGTDCNDDGGDTVLDFFFERYVVTTGEFVLWVEPLDVSSTTPKTILMYYGNSGASDLSDEAGTYGALGEVAVYNLKEDPGTAGANGILDSTSNSNDGTDNGTMTSADSVPGQLGTGFDLDGTDDYIQTTGNELKSASDFTVMYWGNIVENGDVAPKLAIWEGNATGNGGGGEQEFHMGTGNTTGGNTSQVQIFTESSGSDVNLQYALGTTELEGEWHHYSGRMTLYDQSEPLAELFLDGAFVASDSGVTAISTTNWDTDLRIGRPGALERHYAGIIDDIRIYTNPLHAMDTLTIYNNTVDSSTFWTFGSEETESGGGGDAPLVVKKIRMHGLRLQGVRLW